ncbi:MAG: diacylglycerol kinase family protein [Vicinamibacterales bacterium]
MTTAHAAPHRVLAILNRTAGSSGDSDLGERVCRLFSAHQIETRVVWLEPGVDLSRLVASAAEQVQSIVAGGGDGTISTVAAQLAGGLTPMGVLPLGTLNHFSKDLGIPQDLEQAVAVIAAGHAAPVDVGEVNGHCFVNNCSVGVYPTMVRSRERLKRQGLGKWFAAALATLRTIRGHPGLFVTLGADGATSMWRTPFVMVGNNEYNETGLHVSGRHHLNGGHLFAYMAPRVPARQLPRMLMKEALLRIMGRRPTASNSIAVVPGVELSIDLRGPRGVDLAVDGEVVRETLPLRLRSRPGALRVLVPPTA